MATKKKAVSKKAVSRVNKLNAPLSQRPYVTIAILVVLVCALAVTIKMIQDFQNGGNHLRVQSAVYSVPAK